MRRRLASSSGIGVLSAAVLAFAAPTAGAAGPAGPPQATTGAAASVTANSAVVNGTVNPNGQTTTYSFQYGTTTDYGAQTEPQSAGSGSSATPVSATLSGLASGTTFHYRVIAINPRGTAVGADQVFTTSGSPPTPAVAKPTATTGAAVNVTAHSAQLNGALTSADTKTTTYRFEYGLTSNYGAQTTPKAPPTTSTTAQPVNAQLSGLQANVQYHYRLVVTNAAGTSVGADRTFTTRATTRANARKVTFRATTRHTAAGVLITINGAVVLPSGVSASEGCSGKVAVQVKKRTQTISTRRAGLTSACKFSERVTINSARIRGVHALRLIARFGGNGSVGPKSSTAVAIAV